MAPRGSRAWAKKMPASKMSARRRRFYTWPSPTSGWPIGTRNHCAVIAHFTKTSKAYFRRHALEALIFRRHRPDPIRRPAIAKPAGVSLLRQESHRRRQDHGAASAHGGLLLAQLQLGRDRYFRRRYFQSSLARRAAESGRRRSQARRGVRIPHAL